MGLLDFLAQPSTADFRGALRNIPVRKGGILPLTEYGDGSARLDWTAGVPGSIMEAFTAPARAYRGEIAPDQMIPEGLNFAGTVALGSAGVPRPRASVGMGGKPAEVSSHLDMSPEARMARAREMGFDTDQVLYHGTGRDVEAFDLSKARDLEGRKRNLGNGAGKVYLHSDQVAASNYAMDAPRRKLGSDPNVMPLYVRGELADDAVWQDAFNRLSGGRPSYDSTLSMKERDEIIRRVDDELKQQGYAGIQTRYRNPDGSIAEIGQTAVFDPTNIRSVNAAFDPANSSSANLLAANPETSAAPGLGLMAAAKQAEQPHEPPLMSILRAKGILP